MFQIKTTNNTLINNKSKLFFLFMLPFFGTDKIKGALKDE